MSFEAPPPDPTNPDLLLGIYHYLKEHNVIRDPRDATHKATIAPLWIEPRFGCPAPGQTEGLAEAEISPNPSEGGPGLVVSEEMMTGIPSAPYEGFLRNVHVQFVIRAYNTEIALSFEQQLRILLNDKRGWMMYNVPVNESLVYRALQPVDRSNVAFTYSTEYSFNLTGPFTPVGE